MAISLVLYRFPKKLNSTLPPILAPAEASNCVSASFYGVFKEPLNVLAPVIDLVLDDPDGIVTASDGLVYSITTFNYATILITGSPRSYWITNIVWHERKWTISLEEDVLATYRYDILNSTQFIDRAGYGTLANQSIVDGLALPLATKSVKANVSNGWFTTTSYRTGTYIIQTLGKHGYIGCTNVYATDWSNLSRLITYLFNNLEWANASEIGDAAAKLIFSPIDYIVRCFYIPIPFTSTNLSPIGLGYWDFNDFQGQIITNLTVNELSFRIPMPKHPQANVLGTWVNAQPSSAQYMLYIPGFGSFTLPADQFGDRSFIDCKLDIDYVSGEAALSIDELPDSAESIRMTGSYAIDIPLAQYSADVKSMGANLASNIMSGTYNDGVLGWVSKGVQSALNGIGSLANSIGGIFGNNNIGDEIVDGITGITAAAASNVNVTSLSNGTGSMLQFAQKPYIVGTFTMLVEPDRTLYGYPIGSRMLVSTAALSDNKYVQVSNPILPNSIAKPIELQRIYQFMRAGFYAE